MEGARRRGAEGRHRGPGCEGAGSWAPRAPASRGRHGGGLGDGHSPPVPFPGRPVAARDELSPGNGGPCASHLRGPGFRLCAGKNNNNKERRFKSKVAAPQERAAPSASRVAKRVRGAAGGDLPCLPGLPARSLGAPWLQPRPPPKSRSWVPFPAFPRGGALRSCPLCSTQQWPKGP